VPTPTYTPLATVTLGSSASSVSFSSIPATYRDLVLVVSGTTSTGAGAPTRFNGDSGSNYSQVFAAGDGSSPFSSSGSGTSLEIGFFTANPAMSITQIMDYSATDKHKTVLVRYGSPASSNVTAMRAARWANTSAITSLAITLGSGSFLTGSTFNLYGIAS
jgi:hypothetical protein